MESDLSLKSKNRRPTRLLQTYFCNTTESHINTVTLYGTPLSLYAGRARSYLIKAGIDYRETTPTSLHYAKHVVPHAGGRRSMPTVELSDGTVIRDGAAIVDYFEAETGFCFSPRTPKQRIISRLFDVIGAEGMLRPAMHYRWNFPEENLDFLTFHFRSVMPPGPKREAMAEAAADSMRTACREFGVTADTVGVVEKLYQELLLKLDAHFAEHPYLLGAKPCVGDFGLIAPFYGHLGRDPKPLSLMQARAIRLFRWVERMNRPEPDIGEFENQHTDYLPDDDIPATLISLLKHIAIDFVPETQAAAESINQWLAGQAELPAGTTAQRVVGHATFEVQGTTITAWAQPYRFFLLQRVQDEFVQLDDVSQEAVRAMLTACDMAEILETKLSRKIGRQNNLEVWL